jgi:nitrate reductase assembly molybdenum cofactor insertion protein NarJ
MMQTVDLLALLADALRYPGAAAGELRARCAEAARSAPDVAGDLAAFVAATDDWSIERWQEQFVGTFDFDPKRSLDIGWHLSGENYDRGDFLVRMRGLLAAHDLDEAGDLPDHLPHALRLLARMPAGPGADLARTAVLPAVEKLLDGLGGADDQPYLHVLTCVRTVVSLLAHASLREADHV